MIKVLQISPFLLILILTLQIKAATESSPQSGDILLDNLWHEDMVRSSQIAIGRQSGSTRFIYNRMPHIKGVDPETSARNFIQQYKKSLGVSVPSEQLTLAGSQRTPGGSHVMFEQNIEGIPVFGADVVVSLNRLNEVVFVASNFRTGLQLNRTLPELDGTDALKIAADYIDLKGEPLTPADRELMVLPDAHGDARLTYRVRLAAAVPRGYWYIFVDALTGEVIHVENRIMYDGPVSGTGAVFMPDPLRQAGIFYGGGFSDPQGLDLDTDELNAQRVLVELKEITQTGNEYFLTGPYVQLTDIEDPADIFPVLAHPDSFIYQRSAQEFEHVMVYYHIDRAYRYLQSLGYEIDGLLKFRADPHGAAGQDNSYYMGGAANFCAFGEGGVDDAEDGAVIWHEYAHAIQENIVTGGMRYSGETKSLQEGSSDYWAASFNRSLTDFAWQQVFMWDPGISALNGPGIFWAGRRVDTDLVYPNDYDTRPDREHLNGRIWSSAMMKIQTSLGREITDKVFIQAHYLWGSGPGLRDAARAVIQADSMLYNGVHTTEIVYAFRQHGLVDDYNYIPVLLHTPLSDTEDLTGPYRAQINISGGKTGPDPNKMWLYYDFNGGALDSVRLEPDTESNLFYADIPGTSISAIVRYYFSVYDSLGSRVFDPWQAPADKYHFYCGPDTITPVITHIPLRDHAFREWPAVVEANVTDNIGVDLVLVKFYVNSPAMIDSFYLDWDAADRFSAGFPLPIEQLAIGDSVFYQITARDKASNQNTARAPAEGFYNFVMLPGGGRIVIGVEEDTDGFLASGDWEWGLPYNGPPDQVSGEKVWATNLLGVYSEGPVTSSLQTPELALNGFEHVTLRVWHWFDIEPVFDGGNVKVTADSGKTWQPVTPSTGYISRIDQKFANPMAGQMSFSGKSGQWWVSSINLDVYREQNIRVRFDLGSDISKSSFGWYIDSLLIVDEETVVPTPRNLLVADNKNAITLIWDELRPLVSWPKSAAKADLAQMDFDKIASSEEMSGLPAYYIYRKSPAEPFTRIDSSFHPVYRDSSVFAGTAYTYYITFFNGATEGMPTDTLLATMEPVTGIILSDLIPQRFDLRQNYPNPFNPSTTIEYHLARECEVTLEFFDVIGRQVRTIRAGRQSAGIYTIMWDGRDDAGRNLSSGIYFYKITADQFTRTMKMLLLK